MQKVISTFILPCFLVVMLAATPPPKAKKDLWQKWAVVNDSLLKQQRPVLIDIYADWCHYCKVMDANTYTNDSVYNYLKSNFYRVKFNGESKDSITWQNKTYKYNSWYKVHDLAVYLTKGNIVYPTTVIIVPGAQPFYLAGELKTSELEMLLKFFGEGHYQSLVIEDYAKSFVASRKKK